MPGFSINKYLKSVIKQGHNDKTLQLFRDIVKTTQQEFTEDNLQTLATFLVSHLFRSFDPVNADHLKMIRNAMIKELSETCEDCPNLIKERDRPSCRAYGVTLDKTENRHSAKRCSKCVNWE